MPIKIVCPHCSQALRLSTRPAAGHHFRCPHCKHTFIMPGAGASGRRKYVLAALALGAIGIFACLTIGFIFFLAVVRDQPSVDNGRHVERVDDGDDNDPPPVEPPPPNEHQGMPRQDDANRPWLSPKRQATVDAAIQRGVDFLKQKRLESGTWSDEYHPAGLAALPALTLLECGVSPDDVRIGKALQYVRSAAPRLDTTYEIALVLLFLERRGVVADRSLIRRLALRLVAGQTAAGGWSYECPVLPAEQEDNLFTVLEALKPKSHEDLFVKESARLPLPEKSEPTGKGPEDLDGKAKEAYAALPPALQRLPALHPPSDSHHLPLADHSDNSNTQFAALGLWAASRLGLPVERVLALTAARFRFSPSISGGWDYHYAVPSHASTPSMTCAGLLGLALGHGLIVQHKSHPTHSAKVDDAIIQHGLKTLAGFIGEPHEYADKKDRPSINLYYLWSLGRVGLLYRARKIGGKDWYSWGVNQVLPWQEKDGSWKANVYPDADATPIINTCFALLFLQRSHLTEDVSNALEFKLEGKQLDEYRK